jgi:protein-arginine kinase activator protein McsA
MAICKDCKCQFEQKFAWSTRCYDCYRIFKAKIDPQKVIEYKTEYIRLPDQDGQWLRQNIKDILQLCHPDKHNNSERSNRITQKLVLIFKQ